MTGWNLASTLWAYSILLTILIAPLGVVQDKWHRYLGLFLISLAGLYLAGLEAFFTTGVYTLFSLEQTLIGTLALIPGPLFVISAGS